MGNTLLEEVHYKVEVTRRGTWRRYGYIDGTSYHEFTSHASFCGMPLVHYTYGRNPETGRRRVARGIIAVGRLAFGLIAIGHASVGLIAVGQLALGVAFGLGQLGTGAVAVGQFAIAAGFGLGQFAAGYVAVGQFALGKYGLGQFGLGKYLWTMTRSDAEAKAFFKALPLIGGLLP
ncbi:MAG TPA: hypothetical protein P5279_04950 [Anaerohalosphaeraceae bacterium]|jgi:hypothetical protein|nr:hypothetical protein [Anaerohalosphaeraceae bacterium]HRT49818.1 hypothetical protein [Anaerohalosphaeraceae bacterium]HRT85523.1 hypothetical protein [Anaerohalosphaeraceae bacterium]